MVIPITQDYLSQKYPYVIYVDFDSTFIQETLLIQWVRFIVEHSSISVTKKLRFAMDSIYRGCLAIATSYSEYTSMFAVKLAYRTFKDFHRKTVDEFIYWSYNGKYLITPNIKFLGNLSKLVEKIRNRLQIQPKIIIYSQGSFRYAIQVFLNRNDVRHWMNHLKLPIDPFDENAIYANELLICNEIFTGELKPNIVTKYNRVDELFQNDHPYVFIGDNKDEWTIKRHHKAIHFINHSKLSTQSIEEVVNNLFS